MIIQQVNLFHAEHAACTPKIENLINSSMCIALVMIFLCYNELQHVFHSSAVWQTLLHWNIIFMNLTELELDAWSQSLPRKTGASIQTQNVSTLKVYLKLFDLNLAVKRQKQLSLSQLVH